MIANQILKTRFDILLWKKIRSSMHFLYKKPIRFLVFGSVALLKLL